MLHPIPDRRPNCFAIKPPHVSGFVSGDRRDEFAAPFLAHLQRIRDRFELPVIITFPGFRPHYVAGQVLMKRHDRRADVDRAIEEFTRSIQKNAGYAPGCAGLADAYC